MINRAELKTSAKSQIRGNIGILFVCTLIILAIVTVLCFIPFIGIIAVYVITPALGMGYVYLFLDIHNGMPAQIPTIFRGFQQNFGKIWLLFFLIGLYTFLWSLLFVIPGIVKAYAYSMAPYILAENPEISASEAIRRSKEMTAGHKGELFVLDLSFIGWVLLGMLTLGILYYIYIIPYMNATFVNAYYALKDNTASPFPTV